ncbi:hypothetical protein GCM10027400_08250 [Pseudoxanthomonas daejeonensis]
MFCQTASESISSPVMGAEIQDSWMTGRDAAAAGAAGTEGARAAARKTAEARRSRGMACMDVIIGRYGVKREVCNHLSIRMKRLTAAGGGWQSGPAIETGGGNRPFDAGAARGRKASA